MFKTAARKIAHNTTMPGLAGKQDLRALQDLIIAEKTVLNSLQKLSADFARASEALRTWGQGEGDDLGDVLTASNALFIHFSSALAVLANHEGAIREQMKSVRTREENLDGLKRRRKSVFSDAEAAERKLSKMSPENKNLQQQTELLNRLREEIHQMDADIMTEEASLGDFKRATVRAFMGRKFGGLSECCEKGTIVGELGKLVISEIPLDPTQPGLPRSYYMGHARTEFLVAEGAREVSEVTYSPDPNPDGSQRAMRGVSGSDLPAIPSSSPERRMSAMSLNGTNPYVQPVGQPGYGLSSPPPGAYPGLPQVEESDFNIPQFINPDPLSSQSPAISNPSVSEFGTFSTPPSNQPSSFGIVERDKPNSPRGGRFATFPVKAVGPRPQPGAGQGGSSLSGLPSTNPYISAPPMRDGDRVPSLEIDRTNDESFSSSVTHALTHYSLDGPSSSAAASGPSAGSSRFVPPRGPPPPSDVKGADFGPQRYSPPPPMYTPSVNQGLPAGAAPSNPPSATARMQDALSGGGTSSSRPASGYETEDGGLAYISSSRADESTESLPDPGDRRVRFGGVSDVDEEMERRREEHVHGHEREQEQFQEEPQPQEQPQRATTRGSRVPVPLFEEEGVNRTQQNERTFGEGPAQTYSQPASPINPDYAQREPSPSIPPLRIPTPPTLMDEQALNAAAAREVSRELDVLMMSSPPPVSPVEERPAPSPLPSREPRPQYGASPYQRREPSPLPPLNTTSQSNSQPTSPRLDNLYVRERDRSASSAAPRIPAPVPESIPAPVSPTASDRSDPAARRPSLSLPQMSQTSSVGSNGTPYRTPLSTPSALPPPVATSPMYNLPNTTGSNGSFSAGGVRTISAAAFRRPVAQVRNLTGDSAGAVDATTSPLNVKKRPLPSSPYPSSLQVGQGTGMRSASASAPHLGASSPGSPAGVQYRQDGEEDDFDYISAYTDNPDRASGYGSGRFATRLDDQEGGIR